MMKDKGLIIDWMDGRHILFDKYADAEKEYDKMILEFKKNKEEIDLQLLKVMKQKNNLK